MLHDPYLWATVNSSHNHCNNHFIFLILFFTVHQTKRSKCERFQRLPLKTNWPIHVSMKSTYFFPVSLSFTISNYQLRIFLKMRLGGEELQQHLAIFFKWWTIFLLNPIYLLNAYPKIIAFNLICEIAKAKFLRGTINSKRETLWTALLNAFETRCFIL